MKVKLKQRNKITSRLNNTNQWKESLPFVASPRGLLIHRVRFASTYMHRDPKIWNGEKSHYGATLWCGGTFSGSDLEFYENPPKDRLLCVRCEAIAVEAGEKTANKLSGRHVHQGKLKAVRTCCLPTDN